MRYATCIVGEAHDGAPLWRVLEEGLHATRACIRRAKQQPGGLLLDGKPARTTSVARRGQVAALGVSDPPPPPGTAPAVRPQSGPLAVVYEDDDLLVANKPSGIPVHPCPGHANGTLGNRVLGHLVARGSDCTRLYPVHRLDLGTSGLVVFCTSAYAFARLQSFMGPADDGRFERTYLAVCEGHLGKPRGLVDAPIARVSPCGIARAVDPAGQRAVTRYRVVASLEEGLDLVELRLETGRTHQIRVHMAHLGHPLLGDELYGRDNPHGHLDRPALHSWRLRLTHPLSGCELEFEAPLPPDMARLPGMSTLDPRVIDPCWLLEKPSAQSGDALEGA